jgi:hypothetical protein
MDPVMLAHQSLFGEEIGEGRRVQRLQEIATGIARVTHGAEANRRSVGKFERPRNAD